MTHNLNTTIDKIALSEFDTHYDQLGNNEKSNTIIERPQHLWMRVAIGIHMYMINDDGVLIDDQVFDEIVKTYNLISNKYYTHATPTLFNAGTNRPQLSSCFLLGVDDDLNSILNPIQIIPETPETQLSIPKIATKSLLFITKKKSVGLDYFSVEISKARTRVEDIRDNSSKSSLLTLKEKLGHVIYKRYMYICKYPII